MHRLLCLFVFSVALFWACSPTVTEPVVVEQKPKVTIPKEPANPCATFAKLSASDKDEAETAYVLYKDYIKLKDEKSALSFWKTAYRLAPASNGRVKYQFDDGVGLYKKLYNNTSDLSLKNAYRDTIHSIYNKRIECFGEEAYILGRMAFDDYYNLNESTTSDETYELFKKAADGMGDTIKYFIINPFTRMIYDRAVDKSISIEEGSHYALKLLNGTRIGLENCKEKECEAWEIINEYSPPLLEKLEGIKGFYSPEYYKDKYGLQATGSVDCDTIQRVIRTLRWGDVAKDDAVMVELLAQNKTHCYVPPPPPGPLKQAYTAYNDGNFSNAVQHFDEFIEKTNDVEKKAKYTLLNAKIYYRDLKNFTLSRKYALKAAEYKSNWGEPFMLIGKLYASSGPLCGPGRGWDSQVVTWPAIEKFEHAKKIDPSVTQEANKWIRQYRQYMPKKEDIFFRSLKAGDTYFVSCWIKESTSIRTAD